MGIVLIFSTILILLGYSYYGKEKERKNEERKEEITYLDHAPTVQVDDTSIDIYSFNRYTDEDESSPINPGVTTTKEEILKGKSAIILEKGSILEISSPIPPWGVQDENTPRDKIIGNLEISLSKDGQNMGPTDIKFTSKHTKEDYIEMIKLPNEPGYYVGQISKGTPSGRIEYVFQFNIK